jgi:hypothetical protein
VIVEAVAEAQVELPEAPSKELSIEIDATALQQIVDRALAETIGASVERAIRTARGRVD